MPKNSIIIKAKDYKYPTTEELKWAYTVSPELSNFGFESKNPMISLISGKRSISEVHRDDQLQYWNNMLLNRNGGLLHTYHNAIVHYQRGVPDDFSNFEQNHYINRIQFDYYLEYFYHQFATVSDTIKGF
ncbi:Cthe_2314 family HEPN domain-containing protein [Pedobacter chinensis]|uniref:Cthe_2314 family HEPN domain-containing protein n=1 Tax=Pedobacter chinensis TaxID=2282421 RepID=UPI0011C07FF3|nr:Cthe_2314 family HEPN domain-containing protein [Pedobacter chinensis]